MLGRAAPHTPAGRPGRAQHTHITHHTRRTPRTTYRAGHAS